MKKSQSITGIMLSLVLILGAILYPLTADRSFSENENRILADFPNISLNTIFSGEFTNGIEDYLSDQIKFRDTYMAIASELRYRAGLQKINDVYLGKNNYLIEAITPEDINNKQSKINIQAIGEFCKNSKFPNGIKVIPIPDKEIALKKLLPKGAATYDYKGAIDDLSIEIGQNILIDPLPFIKAAQNNKTTHPPPLYFHTDHHWTAACAGLTYYKLAGEKKDASQVPLKIVSHDFYGSTYSKILNFHTKPDILELPDLPVPSNLTVAISGNKEHNIYHLDALKKKDKYSIYFGGNYRELKINTGQPEEKGHLLIIKDSFANSIVPFMLEDYSKITMIDLRYFLGSLKDYIAQEEPDSCIILYEMSNILKDENIVKLAS